MSTIYEQSTSNPSTQLTTFVEFEFNKTSLVYSGLILVSFRSAWACIRSVHSTYIDVYCFRMVKNTKLFAIAASFRFFVRNRGFSLAVLATERKPLSQHPKHFPSIKTYKLCNHLHSHTR